jgi:hypothetical protein
VKTQIVQFGLALILLTAGVGANAQTIYAPVSLQPGTNEIPDIAGDGTSGSIVLLRRENGNAWSYDIYIVEAGGSVATYDDGKDMFRNQPHTGEDVITSVRFAKSDHLGRNTLFALVSSREIVVSVPEPAKVSIKTYALVENVDGLGTPYRFELVSSSIGSQTYCNADMALRTELGVPLSPNYQGSTSSNGC